MSKFYLAVVALSLVSQHALAQSLTPQVISPAGSYLTGSNGSLSFTLGETAVEGFASGAGSLTQGFQPTVGASIPLPLDFLSLTAKLVNGQTQLEWITTHEVNTDYFAVERSTDGRSFDTIAIVAAINPANGSADNTYRATDSLPLPGIDYYRLKEVDQDGQATYSPIVSVKISAGLSCIVYPNPVTDRVFISISSKAAARAMIAIYDLRGQLVAGQAIDLAPGQNQFDLNIADKPKGMYIIKILGLEGLPTYSILKK